MKTLQIIIFSLIVATFVCGNDNVSNLISGFRNLTTITRKLPISEQSEIYEKSMISKKELLELAETNKNITVILGQELLNTPLPKKSRYGDFLYVCELTDILGKQNRNLLLSCTDKILDSTNWSRQATCRLLSKILRLRRLYATNSNFNEELLRDVFLKAANDKRMNVKSVAIRGLIGVDPILAEAAGEFPVEPIDQKNGEIIAKQIIENAEDDSTKIRFYKKLYKANLAKSDYVKYLKEEMSDTNVHLFARKELAEKLLSIKEIDKKEVDELKEECKNLIEKSQREAKAANYDAESKEKQEAIKEGMIEAMSY